MKKNKILAVAASSIGLALLGGASSYATITTDSNGVVETISGYNTISVSNVEATDSFIACKIVDVKYDSTTNAVDYDFTDQFKSFQQGNQTYGGLTISDYMSTYSGSAEGALTGNTNLDALAAAYTAWLRNGHTSGTGSQCSSMTTNAPTASTTISTAGSYIILPVSSTKVYSVMIASVGVKEQNNDYVLDNSTYADITAKKGNPGAIEKTANGTTFAVGEDITYVLEVTVPAYPSNAINTQFVIEDNACYNSAGSAQCTNRGDIVFDTNQAPVVKDGNNTTLTAGTDYTITFTNSRLVVTIPQTKGVASPITITYVGCAWSS